MQIRPVDVHDDTDFHAFFTVHEASQHFQRPFVAMWGEAEAAVAFRRPDSAERSEAFVAVDGDTVVGAGIADFPLLDNTDKVYFTVDVHPDHRRRGIGTALVDHVVDRAKNEDRSVLIGMSHYPTDADEDHPYRRFATSCGFDLANTELHRVAELPVSEEAIQGWVDECAPHHDGYRIETHVDDLPPALLPSYVRLKNQLAVDAPTGDLDFEEEGLTVEGFLERSATLKEQGRTVYITLATIGEGDAVQAVAHSVIAVPADGVDEPHLHQWATLVRRGHRGHRLGLATKAANLRAVQKNHPERTLLHTSNSAMNGPMVAINERIGFRPVEVNAEFLRRLV